MKKTFLALIALALAACSVATEATTTSTTTTTTTTTTSPTCSGLALKLGSCTTQAPPDEGAEALFLEFVEEQLNRGSLSESDQQFILTLGYQSCEQMIDYSSNGISAEVYVTQFMDRTPDEDTFRTVAATLNGAAYALCPEVQAWLATYRGG